MSNLKIEEFKNNIRGKKVSVIGLGISNIPAIKYLNKLGAYIVGRDKKEEIPEEILELVEQRKKARQKKNWEESDRLRDLIQEKGYIIKDTKAITKVDKAFLNIYNVILSFFPGVIVILLFE